MLSDGRKIEKMLTDYGRKLKIIDFVVFSECKLGLVPE
jgi:hypothetical protein